jgi:hypothetical protein
MHNISSFVFIFESPHTVQYRRRHRLPKMTPQNSFSFQMQFAVSSSCFPASFPVDTVHVFHPNQLHSSHVTSLLLNHSRSTRFRHLVARHLQPKSSTTTVCFLYQLFILQLTTSSASSTGCFSPCFRRQAHPGVARTSPSSALVSF